MNGGIIIKKVIDRGLLFICLLLTLRWSNCRGLPFVGLRVECKSSQRTATFLRLPFLRTENRWPQVHEDSGASLSLERGGREREEEEGRGGREGERGGRDREKGGMRDEGEGEVIGFHTKRRPNFTKTFSHQNRKPKIGVSRKSHYTCTYLDPGVLMRV